MILSDHAGQPAEQVATCGREGGGCRVGVRLMIAQPHQLGSDVRSVGDQAGGGEDPVGTEPTGQCGRLVGGPPVQPDDGRSKRPERAVDRHDAVHLRGQTQVADLGRTDAGAGQQLANGRRKASQPLTRILLGPAAGRVVHGAGLPGRADLAAIRVKQDRLDALRADVRADQVTHPPMPSRLAGPGSRLLRSACGVGLVHGGVPRPDPVPRGLAATGTALRPGQPEQARRRADQCHRPVARQAGARCQTGPWCPPGP